MGNDDVTLGGSVDTDHTNVVQYASGDGNDTVTTFSETDTLQITSGSISGAELIGNNVIITVGGGKITLVEANNMNINILDADGVLSQTVFSGGGSEDTAVNDTLISGTDGDDYISNDKGSNVTITGLGGNDTIENTGDNTIIDSGEGDNLVSVAGAEFVTVTTGDGSNTIYSDSNGASGYFHFGDGNNSIVTSNRYSTIIGGFGGNGITLHNGSFESSVESGSGDDTIAVGHYDITVDAGEGNDLINLYRDAENSLIRMGKGNDTVMIYNNQHAQTFQYSGGNDIITGFDADDTLRIFGHTSSDSMISDGNIILDFGDDSITLAGVSSADSLNIEYLGKWSTIEGGFVYSGHTTNNYEQTADVSLVGAGLKDEDGDGAPDNVTVSAFNYSSVTGVLAAVSGLSGEITLNNSPVGVIGDDNYEDHFTAKVIDNVSDAVIAYSKTKTLRGISTGATVNPNENDIIGFDENAKVHMGDINRFFLYNPTHKAIGNPHAQIGIINNDAGADLTVENDILTEIGGLEDGYSISLVPSNNIGDEVTFGTDGGQGTISVGDTTLIVDGDEDFAIIITGDTNVISGLKNFSGSATLIGNETFDSDIALAIQRGSFTLGTDENYSSATLSNSSGESLNVYYTNDTAGGVIDLSDETLTNTLLIGQGEAATVIGSQGDDQLMGNSPDVIQVGNAGNDTFRGGEGNDLFVYSAGNDIIIDYANGDKISLGAAISNTSVNGSDVIFTTELGTLTVQNAASKNIDAVDSSDEYYSRFLEGKEQVTVTSSEELSALKNAETPVIKISGNQTADLTDFANAQIVSLGSGQQTVKLNSKYGNVIIADKNSSGNKNIVFNGGADLGIFNNSNVAVNVDLSNAENSTITANAGNITLGGYDYDNGAKIFIPNVGDITDAVAENSVAIDGNKIKTPSATIAFDGSENSRQINLIGGNGRAQKVGFVENTSLDLTGESENFLIKGDTNSTITSGNGNDTIVASSGAVVDAGSGQNQIYISTDEGNLQNTATVVMGNGSTTVHGFGTGYDPHNSRIKVNDFSAVGFSLTDDGLLLTSENSRLKLADVGVETLSADTTSSDTLEKILIVDNSSTIRTAIAKNDHFVAIADDSDFTPQAFIGQRSGLNFSNYNGELNINLAEGNATFGTSTASIQGFNKLQAGKGFSTLIGNDENNTLIAGDGHASLSGGKGDDILVGNSNSSSNNGQTTFFFSAGDGSDVISNFNFDSDKIYVGDSYIYDAYRSGNNVVVTFDQNSYLTVENAVGKNFRIGDMVAKVDKNISYDGLASCYVASDGSSLTVDSSVNSAEIWLDNSHGTQFLGEIKTLDASKVKGKTKLIGNNFDDTIIGGCGDSSLWGGSSVSDDLLIGGSSKNTFFYCNGNGNDTVQSTNNGDLIMLTDISMEQIISADITSNSVALNFADGGSFQVNGSKDVTYQLANGSKFSANHQSFNWESK